MANVLFENEMGPPRLPDSTGHGVFGFLGGGPVRSLEPANAKPYAALFLPLPAFFIFQCAKGYLCPQFGHSQAPWRVSTSDSWNMLTTRWHCRHIVGWLLILLLSITFVIFLKPSAFAGHILYCDGSLAFEF